MWNWLKSRRSAVIILEEAEQKAKESLALLITRIQETEDAKIAEIEKWRKVGDEFYYLGQLCVVTQTREREPRSGVFYSTIHADYMANGVITKVTWPYEELPVLRNQIRA